MQQQFIYVNSIVNDQRQQQNQSQRQNSGNIKRTLQVRAAFPTLMNNANSQSNMNENNVSANTLLATQLLQLRSDEIDRLNSTAHSAKNGGNNTSNSSGIVPTALNQHSHTSLSASSLAKQNSVPSAQAMHHSSSTNSMNKVTPLIINDDMNLIQVKKITQQQSDASINQDNISKQLMLNSNVQQQIQQARRNDTLEINNRNSSKQTNQIISISSCNNQNGSNSNIGRFLLKLSCGRLNLSLFIKCFL